MKRLTLLLMLVLSTALTFAQPSLRFGEEFDPKGTIYEFMGEVDGKIYCISASIRKSYLQVIDTKSLNHKQEFEITFPEYNGRKMEPMTWRIVGDRIQCFFSVFEKDSQARTLVFQEMDLKGNFIGKAESMASVFAKNRVSGGGFDVKWDDDQEKYIFFKDPNFERYGKEEFEFTVRNTALEEVWSAKFSLPFLDSYFTMTDYKLDAADNIWALCSFDEFAATKAEKGRKEAKAEAKLRGSRYTYSLIRFDHKKESIKEYKIELEAPKQVIAFDYSFTVDGKINLVGTYGDKDSNGALGIFYMLINTETGKVERTTDQAFEVSTIASFEGERRAGKGDGIGSFRFRQFIGKQDGGLTVCGEIYRSYQVCTTDPRTGATRCSQHYEYNSILVIDIDPKGNIAWTAVVPKFQHTVNDGGFLSSYLLLIDGSDLYFIFNDNMKNFDPNKKPKRRYGMTGAKKSVTAVAKVDAEGKVDMKPDVKLKETKMLLRPKVYYRRGEEGNSKVFTLAYRKRERCVEIELQK